MEAVVKEGSAASEQPASPSKVDEDMEWDPAKEVMDSLRLTAEDVARFLKVDQRYPNGQAHPDWLEARRNRVTASRFASACGLKGARSTPEGVVNAMMQMPEGDRSNAGRFGVKYEDVARQAYVQERRRAASEADPPYAFAVREVGVCVWEQEPWLAASPDGIVCENGVPCGLLEVKTARFWTDEAEERLSTNMPWDWVCQVQGGMRLASAALGTHLCWCDVFLWTPQRSGCRRVAFDAELWEGSIFPKLRSFYFERFLPRAADKVRARRRRADGTVRKRMQRKSKKK
mmetsp:Transcript_48702/g.150888  ORF Transcript_48702/g.150888 Transcript_48702/m.150888 type:complete len:288 (+) Transcript_48702:1-864(+)